TYRHSCRSETFQPFSLARACRSWKPAPLSRHVSTSCTRAATSASLARGLLASLADGFLFFLFFALMSVHHLINPPRMPVVQPGVNHHDQLLEVAVASQVGGALGDDLPRGEVHADHLGMVPRRRDPPATAKAGCLALGLGILGVVVPAEKTAAEQRQCR